VVTCFDGYAMARKGRAGPALGIAAFGSFIAGTLSTVGLMFIAPALANFSLEFGPPEFVMLMIMGMTVVTYLTRTSMIKALIMTAFGILVGCIGMDPVFAKNRFTFGIPEFIDGIGIAPMVMGLFGIGEVLNNVGEMIQGGVYQGKIKGLFPNKEDWRRSALPLQGGRLLDFLWESSLESGLLSPCS